MQENHYDPWGWNLVGIETEGDPEHKWQFIDREKLEELGLNWYDLKARGYESVLGRFHSVDPKPDAEDQERLSTYHYSANNPILLSDPNGDCPKCWWESIKNWINAPISPLAQETGKAYMQSMTGRDITPTTQGQFILAAIGYGSQRFAGSVPGSLKIQIPRSLGGSNRRSQALLNPAPFSPRVNAAKAKLNAATQGSSSGTSFAVTPEGTVYHSPTNSVTILEKITKENLLPNSRYTQVVPSDNSIGLQNTITDGQGKIVGQVDFRNHGGTATSGHGHVSQPNMIEQGHHKVGIFPHILPQNVPTEWSILKPGTNPKIPIGQ